MKLLKYFIGSLIMSFGVLIVAAVLLMALQIQLTEGLTRYFLLLWVLLAIVILPFAKNIIRI